MGQETRQDKTRQDAESEGMLMYKANRVLADIDKWLRKNQLELAPEKTEAIMLTGLRKNGPISFHLRGTQINPSDSLKYLGIVFDRSCNMYRHIQYAADKADRTIAALGRLMPKINGPRAKKRRVMCSVGHSILLYAAPIWVKGLNSKKHLNILLRTQRKMALRISCAFSTTSTEALLVIAGVTPISLMAEERAYVHNNRDRLPRKELVKAAKTKTATRWQRLWADSTKGLWTRRLIPNIRPWVERKHGDTDYYVTQALTGHGYFGAYVHRIGKAHDAKCRYCDEEDTPEHTLFSCLKWRAIREDTFAKVNIVLTPDNITETMIENEEKWNAIANMIRHIISIKETDSRIEERR